MCVKQTAVYYNMDLWISAPVIFLIIPHCTGKKVKYSSSKLNQEVGP